MSSSIIKKIRAAAIETLQIEAQAISELVISIDEAFVNTVLAIWETKNRVVITGIGKSAIIAQKMVATLNSTGTPSLFMHAADAIHGDLGMIQAGDVIICLSKSGETPEIKVLVPLLKNSGNTLVAIVSNKNSYLAKNATYVLHTPIPKEACPNNLAPTTSTTAQLAMGDALAVALLKVRGFSATDFAKFHPGGALGKQLYLTVADIYQSNQKPSVSLAASLSTIILEISEKRLGATVVLDAEQKVVGYITDGDLRRVFAQPIATTEKLIAQDIMTKNPKTIHKHDLAVDALQLMRSHKITQAIVMDGEQYEGIVHIHDLLREGFV